MSRLFFIWPGNPFPLQFLSWLGFHFVITPRWVQINCCIHCSGQRSNWIFILMLILTVSRQTICIKLRGSALNDTWGRGGARCQHRIVFQRSDNDRWRRGWAHCQHWIIFQLSEIKMVVVLIWGVPIGWVVIVWGRWGWKVCMHLWLQKWPLGHDAWCLPSSRHLDRIQCYLGIIGGYCETTGPLLEEWKEVLIFGLEDGEGLCQTMILHSHAGLHWRKSFWVDRKSLLEWEYCLLRSRLRFSRSPFQLPRLVGDGYGHVRSRTKKTQLSH